MNGELNTNEAMPPVEEMPIAEEGIEEEGETIMTHTVDEIPALAGLAVGDTLTFEVINISEDGANYDLEMVPMEEEMPEEEVSPEMAEEAPTGREAVAKSLI